MLALLFYVTVKPDCMTLSVFIELSAEQKRAAVLKQGVPLAKWSDDHYQVFLFQLPQFYVETYCCKQTKDIQEFRLIPGTDQLAHYLQQISIEGMFKN